MGFHSGPERCSVGWHLSIQVDTSGLQFPLSVRLIASVSKTEVISLGDLGAHVPPSVVPPMPPHPTERVTSASEQPLVGLGSPSLN